MTEKDSKYEVNKLNIATEEVEESGLGPKGRKHPYSTAYDIAGNTLLRSMNQNWENMHHLFPVCRECLIKRSFISPDAPLFTCSIRELAVPPLYHLLRVFYALYGFPFILFYQCTSFELQNLEFLLCCCI